MATVNTPHGKTLTETNPVALAYYQRQDGYTVTHDEPAAPAAGSGGGQVVVDPDAPPNENASLDEWAAFATAHGDLEAATKTRNQLRDEYKAAHPAT